jgi:hypothetical protein
MISVVAKRHIGRGRVMAAQLGESRAIEEAAKDAPTTATKASLR